MATRAPDEAVPHVPEADTFDFRTSLQTLRQAVRVHLWFVFATVVLTIGLVGLYIVVWPPVYEAEVIIAADSEKDAQRAAFYQGWNVFRKDGLQEEAALATSPPVLRTVVERLDLRYDDVYHPFMSYVVHLWGESWVGRRYRAVKAWLFPPAPSPYTPTAAEIERGKVLKDFKEGVRVTQVGEASIGLLQVKASNQKVAEIANAIIDAYLEQRRERYIREAQQAYESLREEADKVVAELEQLDRELKKFRADNGLILLFEKDKAQIGQWLLLRSQVTDLEAAIADQENALAVVNRQLAGEAEQISSARVFRDIAAQERIVKLEAAVASARQVYQPDAPEVRELEEQIASAMSGIAAAGPAVTVRNAMRVGESYEQLRARRNAIESQLAGARASVTIKKAEAERMRALLDAVPEKMQVNHEYERRQRLLEAKYNGLNEKLGMAAVSMATARSAPPAMRVVDRAAVPEKPVWPRTNLLLLGAAALGLLLGVVGALLLELVFARANERRLANPADGYRLLAIVDRDDKFVERIYASRAR